jgi:hypothetical protein
MSLESYIKWIADSVRIRLYVQFRFPSAPIIKGWRDWRIEAIRERGIAGEGEREREGYKDKERERGEREGRERERGVIERGEM